MKTKINPEVTSKIEINTYRNSDSETGEILFDISYKAGRQRKTLRAMDGNKIEYVVTLLENAGVVNERESFDLEDLLRSKISQGTNEEVHSTIGWVKNSESEELKVCKTYLENEIIESRYVGKLDLTSKGDMDSYIPQLSNIIADNVYLQTIFATAFSGFVSQALRLQGMDDINIVLNLSGETSLGKSTASKLATSIFGKPSKLMRSFNSTANMIQKSMAEYGIIPFVIDDMAVGDKSKKTVRAELVTQIMAYSNGTEKRRFADKEIKYFNCPVISSTETRIGDLIKNTDSEGVYYRFIELYISQEKGFFKSAEEANAMNEFTTSSYGILANIFAEKLIEQYSTADILDMYNSKRIGLINRYSNNNMEINVSRAMNRIAVLGVVIDLISELLTIPLDKTSIIELLLNSMNEVFVRGNISKQIARELRHYIKNNPTAIGSSVDYDINKHRLVIATENYEELIFITCKNLMSEILSPYIKEENSVYTERQIIKELIDNGVITSGYQKHGKSCDGTPKSKHTVGRTFGTHADQAQYFTIKLN